MNVCDTGRFTGVSMGAVEVADVLGCLHDGSLETVTFGEDGWRLVISIDYLAQPLGRPGECVVICHSGPDIEWRPWDGEGCPVQRLVDLPLHGAEVMRAQLCSEGAVALLVMLDGGSGGELVLEADSVSVRWADGTVLSASDVLMASETYWSGFEAKRSNESRGED